MPAAPSLDELAQATRAFHLEHFGVLGTRPAATGILRAAAGLVSLLADDEDLEDALDRALELAIAAPPRSAVQACSLETILGELDMFLEIVAADTGLDRAKCWRARLNQKRKQIKRR